MFDGDGGGGGGGGGGSSGDNLLVGPPTWERDGNGVSLRVAAQVMQNGGRGLSSIDSYCSLTSNITTVFISPIRHHGKISLIDGSERRAIGRA